MRRAFAVAVLTPVALVMAGIAFLPIARSNHAEAPPTTAKLRAEWKSELARGARERPSLHFENLSEEEFSRRLQRASKLYGFEVVSVELLRPKQLAPMVVVATTDALSFVRDVPTVLRSLDPKAATGDDRTGWAWEGFFFEVRDGEDRPALATFNFWRKGSGGGGQWATEESLYPFPHG